MIRSGPYSLVPTPVFFEWGIISAWAMGNVLFASCSQWKLSARALMISVKLQCPLVESLSCEKFRASTPLALSSTDSKEMISLLK